jgi:hypothetical protein
MGEAERERIAIAQMPLADRICEFRAIIRDGQAARARSYTLWDAEMMKPQDDIQGLFTQAIKESEMPQQNRHFIEADDTLRL